MQKSLVHGTYHHLLAINNKDNLPWQLEGIPWSTNQSTPGSNL